MADENEIDNLDEVMAAITNKAPAAEKKVVVEDDEVFTDPGDEEEDEETELEVEDDLEFEEVEEEDETDPEGRLEKVTIDGKVVEVPLKELKSNYSAARYIDKNVQAATEARKKADENAGYIMEIGKATVNKLKQIDAVLKKISEPAIDWEKLK